MKLQSRFALVLATVALAANAHAVTPGWSFEHPRLLNGDFLVKSACMMPAEGKLSKLGMKGSEGMSKESDEWSTNLQNVVEAHLKTASVQLMSATDPGASGASDEEIRQIVTQVQQKYAEISAKINRHPKDIRKSRFTLGDQVALLPCAAKSDVLVFVQGEGQVVTGGKRTMSLLIGGGPAGNYATLILTMADAKTGEIVGFARIINSVMSGEKFLENSDEVYGKPLDKQFTKMRIGSYFGHKDH
jgi:hypothetical protein